MIRKLISSAEVVCKACLIFYLVKTFLALWPLAFGWNAVFLVWMMILAEITVIRGFAETVRVWGQ